MRRCRGVPLPCCSPAPLLPRPSAPLLPCSQHGTGLVTNLAVVKVKLKVAQHHAVVGAGNELGHCCPLIVGGGDGAKGVKHHLPRFFAGFGVAVPGSVFAFKGETEGGFQYRSVKLTIERNRNS